MLAGQQVPVQTAFPKGDDLVGRRVPLIHDRHIDCEAWPELQLHRETDRGPRPCEGKQNDGQA